VAEFPGANCLDLSKTETYDVLEKLYGEICEKFDTPFVNVCLDESYDFGKFKSKNWIKDQGGKAEVFKNHILWLYDLLHERYGKEMLIYHDSLVKWGKDRIGDFPKGDEGLKVIYWDYNKKPFYRRLKYLVKRGFFVIASPSITNWSRPFPNIEHALGNIKKLATYAAKHGAHGFLNSSWGDFCNENLRTLDLLGFGIGSYFAWNPADFNEDHFSRAFFSDFLGMFNGHLMWDTLLELNFINRGGPWSTPFFDRLWEHPLPPHEPVYPRKAARNDIAQVDIAEEMLLRSERTIVRNNDIVDYLKYCVNIVRYNAQKALLSHKMYSVWKDTNKIPVKYRKSMVELKKRNNLLWQQYEKLWLHAAKKEGLERVQRKKESVDRIYQDLISLMEHSHIDEHSRMDETKSKKNPPPRTVTKIHYHNQYLQSEWIVHPDFRGWKDVANEFDLAFPFMFKKTFRIPPKSSDMLGIQYAKLQTIAHTYLRVKINGQHVGECISRFFLSPVIFDNSVQIFDVKEYLQEGENTLEVEAWEFSGSITTINILLEVGWKNDTIKEQDEYSKRNPIKIRSNSDWLVSAPKMDYAPKMESAPILEYRFTYNNFKVAQSLGKPLEVNGNIWAPI